MPLWWRTRFVTMYGLKKGTKCLNFNQIPPIIPVGEKNLSKGAHNKHRVCLNC